MIRFANKSDIENITTLWNDVFKDSKESILNFLKYFLQYVLVYEEENKITGMITMLPVALKSKKGRYVYAVATDTEFRGKGIGTRLLDFSKAYIKECGEDFLVLVPAEKNLFGFYEKRGFITVSCIENCEIIPQGESAVKNKIISASEYVKYRREIFNDVSLIEWSITDFEIIKQMYSGEFYKIPGYNAVFFAYREKDLINIKELCCREADLQKVKEYLSQMCECKKIKISCRGVSPYAMIYPKDVEEDIYFNIALD